MEFSQQDGDKIYDLTLSRLTSLGDDSAGVGYFTYRDASGTDRGYAARRGAENLGWGLNGSVQMPLLDGLTAARTIRVRQPGLTIIAMTANVMHGDRQACMQAGMDDYISKPLQLDKLVALLRRWARQPKTSDVAN